MKKEEVVELRKEFAVNYETVNYLEEHITTPIWEMLYENFDKLPKQTKIELIIRFTPI